MNKVAEAFALIFFMLASIAAGISFAAWMLMLSFEVLHELKPSIIPGLPYWNAVLIVVFFLLTKIVWTVIGSLLKKAGGEA